MIEFAESDQPPIFPFGLRIDYPVTVATDLLVTAVCLYAFFKLSKDKYPGTIYTYLRIYFLSMGIATAVGGIIGHGFLYYFGFYWKLPGWFTSMLSIAVLERACIYHVRDRLNDKFAKFLGWLNIVELITFMVISFYTLNFLWVEVHSAYGLAFVVFSLSIYNYRKTKDKGSYYFIIAVLVSSGAAITFITQYDISIWFNHYDISHVFMAISAYFFYLGAKNLGKVKLS